MTGPGFHASRSPPCVADNLDCAFHSHYIGILLCYYKWRLCGSFGLAPSPYFSFVSFVRGRSHKEPSLLLAAV